METISILKIVYFAGGLLMFFGLAFYDDRKKSKSSLWISKIFFVLADLLIVGSLIGQYVFGTDVTAVLVMFLLLNFIIFRKIKKSEEQ